MSKGCQKHSHLIVYTKWRGAICGILWYVHVHTQCTINEIHEQ